MIYFLFGENRYELEHYIKELSEKHAKDHGENSVERIDGEFAEPESLQRLSGVSLFDPVRLLIVSDFSANKKITQSITEVIETIPESNTIVFTEHSVKKNTNFYKELSKLAETKEFKNRDVTSLEKWLIEQANKHGGKLEKGAARNLIKRVGIDQNLLVNELGKLIAYESSVQAETINKLVEQKPDDNVFDMLELLSRGDSDAAKTKFRELRRAQLEPHYVMNMIGWQLSNMAIAVANRGKTAQQIANESGISPFVVQKALAATRRINRSTLSAMIEEAAKTDLTMKTTPADPDQVVELLISKLGVMIK